jgi:hypothetical protein
MEKRNRVRKEQGDTDLSGDILKRAKERLDPYF